MEENCIISMDDAKLLEDKKIKIEDFKIKFAKKSEIASRNRTIKITKITNLKLKIT